MTGPDSILTSLFPMHSGADDEAWMRHTHPVSVWSRIVLGLPLLAGAAWSRSWIGDWWLVAFAGATLFLWLNPRMTPRPKAFDTWGARAVLGERVWVRSEREDLPPHHRDVPRALVCLSAIGHALLAYGVYVLDLSLTLVGLAAALLFKMWFLDRMVWLHRDRQDLSYRCARAAITAEGNAP